MDKNKHNFFHRPKYNSTYIKDLHRKVLFKDKLFLVDLTLRDANKIGGGHVPRTVEDDTTDDTHNMIPDISVVLGSKDLKVRFINMIYRQVASEGVAVLILRKITTTANLTWKQLRNYSLEVCKRFSQDSKLDPKTQNSCFKINEHLVKNLVNLIPFGFEPKNILNIAGDDNTNALLVEHFTNAKIDTIISDKLYDLVICDQYLHHVNDKKKTASEISNLIKPDGYLFVRDSDIESNDDQLLLDILHDFYDYITMNSGVYKQQKLNYISKENIKELFPKLEFQSESHTHYDSTNPIKAFNMLFKSRTP